MGEVSGVDVAFVAAGAASVWFGWRVFMTDSMVRASFALLASFVNVAVILLLLLAEYLATSLVFMMAIEMTVMALFMIAFMMDSAGLNPMQMVHQHAAAIALGWASAIGLGVVAGVATPTGPPLADASGTVRALGRAIMGESMLVMQTAAVVLVTTMIGAVVLTSATGRFGDAVSGSRPPPLDPDDPDAPEPGPAVETGGGHAHHDHGGHG
jgi:NADH:ubiquinone oxidoreductase subunit 6 (subunit J)